MQSRFGRVFMDWARYPVLETESLQGAERGYLVRFYDVRYAYPERPRPSSLSGWVQLDSQYRVVAEGMGER